MTKDDVECIVGERQRERVSVLELDSVLHAKGFSLCASLTQDPVSRRGMLDADDGCDMRSETASDGTGPAAVERGVQPRSDGLSR